MSAAHPSRPSGESILQAWIEHGVVHCTLELAAGADHDAVRARMVTLLTEAATGQYWAGRWKHVDLDERWHVLLVTMDEGDGDAELGGSHLDGHHAQRVPARDLVEAARDYLETHG